MKQLIALTAILLTITSSFSQTQEQDSLTIQLAYQKQDSSKVDTSIQLIKSYYNSKDFKKALLHIVLSEKLSSSLKYSKGSAEIKYYKALVYSKKDDYFNAYDNYNKSLQLFTLIKDSLGIAKANNGIGLIEIRRGNYNKGLKHSLSAIKIFENKNLKHELSLAYNNLAEAYYKTKQFDRALDFNIKTLQVREQLRDSLGIISSSKNIGSLYSMRKEHRKAIEYYEKTLSYIDLENDKEIRGNLLSTIGAEYLKLNDIKNASTYLLQSLRLNKNINNKNGILKTYNSLAYLNLKLKKIRLAESQLDNAFSLTRQVDNDTELLENYRLQITVDSTNRDYRRAFNWQNKYHKLKDKIKKENAVPVAIEDSLDFDIPTNTIVIPQDVLQNESEPVKKLKLFIYGLIVLLIILGAILIGILLNRKSKNNTIFGLKEKVKSFSNDHKVLLEKNKELEESNQVKDRLFSIVSHDLKDSITSVKAFLDLLKEGSITKKEFDNLIPELSENADSAAALLLNLLNWSKSQMEYLEPKPTQFNIQEIFKEKVNLIDKKAEEKRIVIIDKSINDFAFADRSMIEIVIQNLLANALKFSKIGDVITISNRERNGNALICIEDTGIGISKENQRKIFKSSGFTTRGTSGEKGTGLGLSICKELVELNKGRIWVESDTNLGSKFFVELPRIKPVS